MGNIDSSYYYFKKAAKTIDPNIQEFSVSLAEGNLGYNMFLRKKYDEAIPLLIKDYRVAMKHYDNGVASGAATTLAQIYLNKGQ